MLWLLLATLTSPAHADAFRLANGSVVEGTLATYELGGNCQIFVAAGPVRGATLLLPCAEILAFQRPGAEAPALASAAPAAPIAVEQVAGPPALVIPVSEPEQAPAAASPAEAPAPPTPSDEPVSASLPEGYALPGDDALAEAAAPEAPPAAPPPANLRGTPRAAPRLDEAAPAAAGASAAAEPAPPAAPPAGWREKGSGGMPRWLYRTIYGEEPPATQGEATEEDAAGDDPAQDG
ncbi:hypothetical protein L6R53_17535 [Myxococcota bacterium]|nr:hypothetical protein [Myxococcota bacterium]